MSALDLAAPVDLDELEKLARAATPGPWRWYKYGILASGPNGETRSIVSWDYAWGEAPDCNEADDKPFIVAANPAAILALITRLRAAEALTAWQPIETAPRDGTAVLVWWLLSTSDAGGIACFNGERWTQRDGLPYTWAPTHWMPLPAAPEAP